MSEANDLMPEETNIEIKKLLKRDILVTHRNTNDFTGSVIQMYDDEQTSDLLFFEVLQASDEVTEVEPGDVVLLPWSRAMLPFDMNGQRVTITSEDEVYAVIPQGNFEA